MAFFAGVDVAMFSKASLDCGLFVAVRSASNVGGEFSQSSADDDLLSIRFSKPQMSFGLLVFMGDSIIFSKNNQWQLMKSISFLSLSSL